jgi:hypothetical protein
MDDVTSGPVLTCHGAVFIRPPSSPNQNIVTIRTPASTSDKPLVLSPQGTDFTLFDQHGRISTQAEAGWNPLTVSDENGDPALNVENDGDTVTIGGYLITTKNAAPADADLAAGRAAIWFDKTNGTAALNIKAKQADGTVKTATIPVIT